MKVLKGGTHADHLPATERDDEHVVRIVEEIGQAR